MRYNLVHSRDPVAFDDTVNALLDTGWELYGPTTVHATGAGIVVFQVLINKHEEPKPEKRTVQQEFQYSNSNFGTTVF